MENSRKSPLSKFCVINNIHGLFIYYLLNPEDFKKTTFVISDGISKDIQKKLPTTIVFPSFNNYPKLISLLLRVIYYNYKKFCCILVDKIFKYMGMITYISLNYISNAVTALS